MFMTHIFVKSVLWPTLNQFHRTKLGLNAFRNISETVPWFSVSSM